MTDKRCKIERDSSKHYPNKNEGKLLRKIMSETGMTEEEVRSFKTYRKQLSEAQQKRGTKSFEEQIFCKILKETCRKLKLPKEHPDIGKKVDKLLEKRKSWYSLWGWEDKMSKLKEKYKIK